MHAKEEYLDALDRMEQLYYNLSGCMSSDSRFKADINLLKGLVNEHFEEKKGSNLEHYKDEIKYAGYEFAVVNGKPTTCKLTSCDKCYFNDKHFTCARKRIEWMLKPYEKQPYKLTRFEYDLLNAYKNSGMKQCISNYSTLLELYEKGHIKDIDISTPIHEILDNCEVIKDENC